MSSLLGKTVLDIGTNLTGIVTQYSENIDGMNRYSVQPSSTDGKMPDAWSIDESQLSVLEGHPCLPVIPPDSTVQIQLGDEVKDIITEISGIATQKTTFLNGCVYFEVVCRKPKADGDIQTLWLNHRRLRIVEAAAYREMQKSTEAVNARIRSDLAPAVIPPPRTGGPMSRALRI